MLPTFMSAKESPPIRELREYGLDRSMSGADQDIASSPEILGWLKRVWVEMADGTRPWDCFDEQKLGKMLMKAGVDLEAAAKAQEDAIPIPREIADYSGCFQKLRGASFLTLPADSACYLLGERAVSAPHRLPTG